MKKLYLLIIPLFYTGMIFGQSPGGVSTGIDLWLRADKGVTAGTSGGGANFTAWADQAAKNTFTINGNPQSGGLVNFNNVITFDGNGDFLTGNTSISMRNGYGMWAFNSLAATAGSIITATTPPNCNCSYFMNGTTLATASVAGITANTYTQMAIPISDFLPKVLNQQVNVGGNASTTFSAVNGTSRVMQAVSGFPNAGMNLITGTPFVGRSADPSNPWYLNGRIGELILYNTASHTTNERDRINSYLGIKYGVSLGTNASPFNYLSSSSTVIWTGSTTYQNNVFGIGRDDSSDLNQKQSKSENAGDQLIISLNTLAANNPSNTGSFPSNGQFLIIGDNNATGVRAFSMSTDPTTYSILNRVWRAQNTSNVNQAIQIFVPTNLYNGVGTPKLVMNNVNDLFANNDSNIFLLASSGTQTISGKSYFVYNVPASRINNPVFFFTITNVAAPGGVSGADRWYKADNGATATQWLDSSSGAANTTTSVSGTVTVSTGTSNFNPTVNMSAGSFYSAPQGFVNNTSANFRAFTVNSPISGVQNLIWSQRASNTGSIELLAPWNDNVLYFDAPFGNRINTAFTGTFGIPNLLRQSKSGGTMTLLQAGKSIATGSGFTQDFGTDGSTPFFIGAVSGNSGGAKNIQEIILYENAATLTATDEQKVDSYLALKYGITLDQTASTDYLNSNGQTVWNGTANSGFNKNIAGIMRDDFSNLHQKQSQSVNTGGQIIVSTGTVATSNQLNTTSITSNFQSLIWGDNGATGAVSFTDTANGIFSRLNKVWKAQNFNSFNQSIKILIPNTLYNGSATPKLIYNATDATFATGNTYYSSTGTQTVNGTSYFVYDVPATAASASSFFFTLSNGAVPGGVNGLSRWYKADYGATATQWIDSSLGGGNTTTSVSGTVTNLAGTANFNPTMNFPTGAFFLSPDAFVVNNMSNFRVFSVNTPIQGQRNTVWSQLSTNGNFANLHAPWDDGNLYFDAPFANRVTTPLTGIAGTFNVPNLFTQSRNGGNLSLKNAARTAVSAAGATGTQFQNGGGFRIGISNSAASNEAKQIQEIILYENASAITTTQERQVESYLAIKYGITLQQNIARDYLNSSGQTVWNSATFSGFNNNIAGIMRDDLSGLLQKQSQSVNTTTDQIIMSTSSGATLPATNQANITTIAADMQSLIWGDNGLGNTRVTFTDPNGISRSRLSKIWGVDNFGNYNQATQILVPSSYMMGDANPALIINPTSNTFTTGTNTYIYKSGTQVVNSKTYFTYNVPAANVNTDFFFTLALGDYDNDGIADIDDLDDDNDGILDTVECAPVEVLKNGGFDLNTNNWSTGAGWTWSNGLIFNQNNIFSGSSQVTQTLTNLDKFSGYIPLKMTVGALDAGNAAGNSSFFDIILNGVTYATVVNGSASQVNNVTLTSLNGAYSDFVTMSTGSNPTNFVTQTFTLYIPYSGPSTANLVFSMNVGQDDWLIDNVSMKYNGNCDIDGDGIPNYLDLDSDADSCPDAIEGGASFTTTNLVSSTMSGGSTNIQTTLCNTASCVSTATATNGVPTVAGTGQGLLWSQTSVINECTDSDGDGIADWQDLDDDNDGILDTVECAPFEHISNTNFVRNTAGWTLGTGWTRDITLQRMINNTDNVVNSSLTQTVSNLNKFTTYIPVTFTLFAQDGLNNPGGTGTLDVSLNGTKYITFSNSTERTVGVNNITAETFNGAFSTFTPFSTASSTNPVSQTVTLYVPYNGSFTSAPLSFTMNADTDDWQLDDITIQSQNCDLDGDGIMNYLDLDSDGDGCPDAIEGAGGFKLSQLFTSTMPGGNSGGGYTGTSTSPVTQNLGNTVGSTATTIGVPTVAGTGQGLQSSQVPSVSLCKDSDADTVLDRDDLDDDNDGILDTAECTATELVTNGTFNTNLNGWTAGTGWIFQGNQAHNNTENLTNSRLSQTVNNLDKLNGVVPVSFRLTAQDAGLQAGGKAELNVELNGVVYAKITNTENLATGVNNVIMDLFNGASSNFVPFSMTTTTIQNITINIPYTGPASATLAFGMSTITGFGGDDWFLDDISIQAKICDYDGDGITNDLDLDSDGDGCTDAIEGGANFTATNLVNSSMPGGNTGTSYIGTAGPVTQNLGNTVGTTTTTIGVPTIAGTGQTVNISQRLGANGCLDSDGDGVTDEFDLDNDNDGILDVTESACAGYVPNGQMLLKRYATTTLPAATWMDTYPSYHLNAGGLSPASQGELPVGGTLISSSNIANNTTLTDASSDYYTAEGYITFPAATSISIRFLSTAILPEYYNTLYLPLFGNNLGFSKALYTKVAEQKVNSLNATIFESSYAIPNSAFGGTYPFAVAISDFTANANIRLQWQINGGAWTDIPAANLGSTIPPCQDTDGDGIPNYLDLDSDNDGCTDAIEGGANFTSSNLVNATGTVSVGTGSTAPNKNLGNTVGNTATTMGVPTIAGTGQTVNNAADGTKNDCLDSDGDGIPDWQDLDDDNDGILDTDEGVTCFDSINPGDNNTITTGGGLLFNLNGNTTANVVLVSNQTVTLTASNCTINPLDTNTTITNVNSATLAQAKTDNEFLAFNFTTNSNIVNASIDYLQLFKSASFVANGPYTLTYAISTDNVNFYDFATVPMNGTVTGSWPNGLYYPEVNVPIKASTTYYFRIYMYGLSSGTTVGIDDIGFMFDRCQGTDTDGDGILNHLDLDSDNDGCTDAIEGGANFTSSNLVNATGTVSVGTGSTANNQNLGNTVGNTATTMGVPTVAGTGQTVNNAADGTKNDCLDSDGDGIPDWQDLDDDNDGILDTAEGVTCFDSVAPASGSTQSGVFAILFGFNNGLDDNYSSQNLPVTNPNSNTLSASGGLTITADSAGYGVISNVTSANLAAAKSSGQYISFPIITRNNIVNASIEYLYYYRAIANNYTMTWSISSDNINFVDLATSTYTGTAGTFPNDNVVLDIPNYPLLPNKTYYMRIYVYGLSSGTTAQIDDISVGFDYCNTKDTDGDGIFDHLDLDSDNDGCTDAIEGGANFTSSNLVNATGTVSVGTGSTAPNKNLGNTVGNTATTMGVPTIAGTGQTVGTSANAAAQDPACNGSCYMPGVIDTGNSYISKVGITSLNRAGVQNDNWPMVRESAWVVLEAKTKGLVVNRVKFNASNQPVANDGVTPVITSPTEGMMVYDTTNNCLKVYTSNDGGATLAWHCMNTQTCPN